MHRQDRGLQACARLAQSAAITMSTHGGAVTRCVEMVGPDTQMDFRGDTFEPVNPLPVKCPHCTLPDLDFVPQPYVLAKGITAPSQISPAYAANFFVRERGRKIIELVAPGTVTIYPTVEKKTKKSTDWFLAAPKQLIEIPGRRTEKPFCSKCGEAKYGNLFSTVADGEPMKEFDSKGLDIFKSRQWRAGNLAEDDLARTNNYRAESKLPPLPWSYYDIDAPPHPERWTRLNVSRKLYFSLRLEQLLKRAKLKGQLVRSAVFEDEVTSDTDEEWITEKLGLLASNGLAEAPTNGGQSRASASNKWFQQYLKRHAAKTKARKVVDFGAIEKKQKVKLPQSYKDFISTVGPKAYEDIMEKEGFTARVLPPAKLDFRDYRRGRVPHLDREESQIDGVMFAATDHGDCFVFDIGEGSSEFPVYWYDHEQNSLEPFAPNFAECVKRWEEEKA